MQNESDAIEVLTSYLKSRGYPAESFAISYPIGKKNKYHADLAILDPVSAEPIALFEVKLRRSLNNEKEGIIRLKSYIAALEIDSIPVYLVFVYPQLEIIHVTTGSAEKMKSAEASPVVELPSFEVLASSGLNLLLEGKKKAQKKQIDQFTAVCLIIASFVLAILLVTLTGRLSISPIQLTLLVIFIGLILAPWASKIKFAGIEFERLKKEESKKNNS